MNRVPLSTVMITRRAFSSVFESKAHQEMIRSQFTQQALPFLEFHNEQEVLSVFQQLGQFKKSDRILDSGCGPGIISRYLAQHHAREVVGIDLTKEMINLAYKESQASNIQNCLWLIGDMTNLPFHDESFDGVVTRYTFHHLQHPIQALSEMIRVTVKGGHIVVLDATPHIDKKDAYNRFERLRDPSHTTALYPLELLSLSSSINMNSIELVATQHSSLTLDAIDLINRAFPIEVNREGLLHLLRSDVGINALDFNARYSDDASGRLLVSFPQTIVVWKKL